MKLFYNRRMDIISKKNNNILDNGGVSKFYNYTNNKCTQIQINKLNKIEPKQKNLSNKQILFL